MLVLTLQINTSHGQFLKQYSDVLPKRTLKRYVKMLSIELRFKSCRSNNWRWQFSDKRNKHNKRCIAVDRDVWGATS